MQESEMSRTFAFKIRVDGVNNPAKYLKVEQWDPPAVLLETDELVDTNAVEVVGVLNTGAGDEVSGQVVISTCERPKKNCEVIHDGPLRVTKDHVCTITVTP